jgi:hypothetical protein
MKEEYREARGSFQKVDVEVSGGINLLVGLCKKKLKVKKG